MEPSMVESGPGWTLWRTPGGTWVETCDDLADVLPEGVDVAVVAAGWPRGRWTFTFTGTAAPYEAPMGVRADPLLTASMTVLAAAKQARVHGALATFGELVAQAPAVGVTAARVTAVLDLRAVTEAERDALADAVVTAARGRAQRDRTHVEVTTDTLTGALRFDPDVVETLCARLGAPPLTSPGVGPPGGPGGAHGSKAAAVALRRRDDALVRNALAVLP
ncbi:hypothetical protein [Mumia quercus]|uniref:hypothetical protein n=1 Tax=Mumia quercus TaxID=2976125 RepID=UPI0021CE2016|nr:hypothetical protein [Mumia quercus]